LLLSVFSGLAVGMFFFIKRGLELTIEVPYFEDALPLYIYEMFLLLIGYLVVISTAITGLFGLFKEKRNDWIAATPNFLNLPLFASFRVFLSSAWPLVIVAIPSLLAMQSVFSFGPGLFIIALFSIILFIAFLVFGTLVLLLTSAKILSLFRPSKKNIVTLRNIALIIALLMFVFSFVGWNRAFDNDIIVLLQAENISAEIASIEPIIQEFKIFPSHIVAMNLFNIQEKNTGPAVIGMLVMLLLFLISALLYRVQFRWFLPLWQMLQEGAYEAQGSASSSSKKNMLLVHSNSPLRAIFAKETLVMFRNMRNTLWLGLLFILLLIQSGLNFVIGRSLAEYKIDTQAFPQFVQMLQFATLVYFMSAFVIRFVLPAFSTELKTAWIMASSPIDLGKLFWSKWWFFLSLFIVLGLGTSIINFFILSVPIVAMGMSFILYVIAIMFLISLGLSLGAFFPNFDTDDPQVISTSFPGLIFILTALSYGGIGAYLIRDFLANGNTTGVFVFIILSIVIMGLLLAASPRALRRIEFAKNIG